MLSEIAGIIYCVREYFFPSFCALCGESLFGAGECRYGLCAVCRDAFTVPGEARCKRCGRPLISEQGDCLSCREAGERFCGPVTTLFPYTGKFRRLLAAYKFGKSRALGHFLAEKIREAAAGLPPDFCWVPVPPRPGKLRSTGWDQVEYLAKILQKDFPFSRCLKRLPSRSQKELGLADRKTNLMGRIRCIKSPPKTVILLDDLVTTGSTMEACAAALKEGGAGEVRGFCLFYD